MKRRDFLINGCTACLSVTVLAGLVSSCKPTQYTGGNLKKDGLFVDTDLFKIKEGEHTSYRSYIIVRNEELKYPVCVYRFSDSDYTALWMQCTHQGAELQVAGTHLQCPAHGSEYNNRGSLITGPASSNLRMFPVTINNNQLFIDLRKK